MKVNHFIFAMLSVSTGSATETTVDSISKLEVSVIFVRKRQWVNRISRRSLWVVKGGEDLICSSYSLR